MRTTFSVVALVLSTGCSEYTLSDELAGEPTGARIEVTPMSLDLGVGDGLHRLSRDVTLRNIGTADLVVDGLAVDGDPSFDLSALSLPLVLAPGAELPVQVGFLPSGAGQAGGVLAVTSNADNAAMVVVDLAGRGDLPELVISPSLLDLGDVAAGCAVDEAFTLSNRGTRDLELYDLAWLGEGLAIDADAVLSRVLAPGAALELPVRVRASAEALPTAELIVASNDPAGLRRAAAIAEVISGTRAVDLATAPAAEDAQIVFLVDQSYSMADQAAALGDAFHSFIATVATASPSWRVGVVTHDDACFNGGVLTAATPGVAGVFRDAVTDNGGMVMQTERLLQQAHSALLQTRDGGCNAGFLDPSVPLHLVVVSDERDQSSGTWASWQAAYEQLVDDVTVHAIVDVASECGVGNGGDGAWGYQQIAEATGGLVLDICDGGWAPHLTELAASTVNALTRIELTRPPADVGAIEVLVDGEASDAWLFVPALRAVVLDAAAPAGSQVEVHYTVAGACP